MRSRPKYYKLIGRMPVPVHGLIAWARWAETASFIVRQECVGPLRISTVFLGLDHRSSTAPPDAPPLLFETMIFGGDEDMTPPTTLRDNYQRRFTTWDEAERGHAEAVEHARRLVAQADAALQIKASER